MQPGQLGDCLARSLGEGAGAFSPLLDARRAVAVPGGQAALVPRLGLHSAQVGPNVPLRQRQVEAVPELHGGG